MVRTLLWVLVRRHGGLLPFAGLAVAALSGCIIPAPIEEEIPEENVPPFIEQTASVDEPQPGVSPPLGIVPIELSPLELSTEFSLLRYGDMNPDQTLYFRAVVEYGGIALAVPAVAVEPEERGLPLTFSYLPCEPPQSTGLEQRTDDNAVLAIGLSDSPFVEPNRRLYLASDPDGNDRIGSALSNIAGEQTAVAVWGLSFEGSCDQ